jgi:hypothetical protein
MQKNGGIKMTSITPYEKFLQDNRKSGYDNSPFRFNPDGTVKSAKTAGTNICEYLSTAGPVARCIGKKKECPKKRAQCNITQACWQVKGKVNQE